MSVMSRSTASRERISSAAAPRATTVRKPDIAEDDLARLRIENHGVLGIRQTVWRGQRSHAVLDLADIGVDRHQRVTDPPSHLRNPDRDRTGSGDIPRRGLTQCPEVKRATNQQNRQNTGQRHQAKPEPGGDDAVGQHLFPEGPHSVERGALLVVGMGKELDRLDVADRVNDLPGDVGPRGRPLRRQPANTRHVVPDHPEIDRQPDNKATSDASIDGSKQQDRSDDGGKREENRLQRLHDNICQRTRRLHFLLRDTAGEIIVEKRHGLPKREAMQPLQDKVEDVGGDHDVLHQRVQPEKQRTQQDEEDQREEQEEIVFFLWLVVLGMCQVHQW